MGLNLEDLKVLSSLLLRYTNDSDHVYFGLWDGWPQADFKNLWSSIDVPNVEVGDLQDRRAVAPRFGVPPLAGRDYFLLCGSLWAAVEMADADLVPVPPTFIWPADRSWFLASDIDLDSTLVGGSAELIEALVDSGGIEAWRIEPDDSF